MSTDVNEKTLKHVGTMIDEEVWRSLKIMSMDHGISMKDLLTKIILDYVRDNENNF